MTNLNALTKAIAFTLALTAGFAAAPAVHAFSDKGAERVVEMEEMSVVDLQITGSTDFGTSMEDIMSGAVTPPPSGARINVAFEGTTTGVLAGTMKGVDYLNIRADGRIELNIQAVIVTPEGERISYEARGVSVAQPGGIGLVREAAKLTTTSPKYTWVNEYTFIAEGTVNLNTGEVDLVLLK